MTDREEMQGRFLDGSLSNEQLEEIVPLLDDPALVETLVLNGAVDDLLRRDAAAARGETQARRLMSLLAGLDAEQAPSVPAVERRPASARRWSRSTTSVMASVASVAAVAAVIAAIVWVGESDSLHIGSGVPQHADTRVQTPVARLSRSVNVEWTAQAHRWSVGDTLCEGDIIDLAAGRSELVFDIGAIMTVVGPAVLEMQSASAVVLRSGTATTRLENSEGGEFRVLTPTTDVVDLGTEFGVRVEAGGKTDVVVFDGAVDLRPNATAQGEPFAPRRLAGGEAVRATEPGNWQRLVSVESDAFPLGDGIFDLKRNRPPLIVGVVDDLRSPESPKFYRIYHTGFADDVRAFVDRSHEWNGLTEDGVPGFLRGADYVATFNDDSKRRKHSPSIELELSGPALLYVFHDDRLIAPTWLEESFEDTGVDIGLDEGPSRDEDYETDVGAGKSIDQTCSIWRRRIEQAGWVKLGPVGLSKTSGRFGRTMYGIAAQPL